jgi:hypothetical protein
MRNGLRYSRRAAAFGFGSVSAVCVLVTLQAGPAAASVRGVVAAKGTHPVTPEAPSVGPISSIFRVDTTADTSPSDPAAACASGNAGTCSLRAAVAAADQDSGNTDEISIPPNTSLTLVSGTLDLTNSMLIFSNGASINGGGSRPFSETAPVNVHLRGVNITGGSAVDGGGIDLDQGTLTLSSVTVSENDSSVAGGGIFVNAGAQLWAYNSTIGANLTNGQGGGLFLVGTAHLSGTTVGGPTAGSGNEASTGAGIFTSGTGTLTASKCTISNNFAGPTYGAGVGIFNEGELRVFNSAIGGNVAAHGGEGVGLTNVGTAYLSGTSLDGNSITESTITSSVAGAGIYDAGTAMSLKNVSLDGNSASVLGVADILGGAVFANDRHFAWHGGEISNTSNGVAGANDYIAGGAVYLGSSGSVIQGVVISGTSNEASGSQGINGGAIDAESNGAAATSDLLSSDSIASTSNTGDYVDGGALLVDTPLVLAHVGISTTNDHVSSTSCDSAFGGAIYNANSLTMGSVDIAGTTVVADLGTATTPSTTQTCAHGGAVFNSGSITASVASITNTSVTASGGNGSVQGGAWYNDGSSILNDVEIVGLQVTADDSVEGGGLVNLGTLTAADFTIGDAIVSVSGGADAAQPSADGTILYSDGHAAITNGTFSGVDASVPSGGAYAYGIEADAGTQLADTTIADDDLSGPAGSTWLVLAGGALSATNSIIASGASAANCAVSSGGSITSGGNNIDSGDTCGFASSGDMVNTDPLVVPLASNGGRIETAALQAGSPAIDAGLESACPPADARGEPRPQGTACDIGSYEFAPGVVNAVSPGAGHAGLTVRITGTGFLYATQVTFGTTSVAFVVRNDGKIVVTVPAGSGIETVTVVTHDGSGTTGRFTYSAASSI